MHSKVRVSGLEASMRANLPNTALTLSAVVTESAQHRAANSNPCANMACRQNARCACRLQLRPRYRECATDYACREAKRKRTRGEEAWELQAGAALSHCGFCCC